MVAQSHFRRLSIILWLIVGCSSVKNPIDPVDYTAPAMISYTIYGGFGGTKEETKIEETGQTELKYEIRAGKFIIPDQLSADQLASVKTAFKNADFFQLRDRYEPEFPVNDGFTYAVTYSVEGNKKTVAVIDIAHDAPDSLYALIRLLRDINIRMMNYPDMATLSIEEQYTIVKWPFSDHVNLHWRLYGAVSFTDSEISRAIYDFFSSVLGGASDETYFLFWEGEHLFEIDLPKLEKPFEANLGTTFGISQKFDIAALPEMTGIDITQIPEAGLIVMNDEILNALEQQFWTAGSYYKLYPLHELKERGTVVSLYLNSGRPL